MSQIPVIIARELGVRLRKPFFWVAALLVPLLLTALYALPVLSSGRADREAVVLVDDETGLFAHRFQDGDGVVYRQVASLGEGRRLLRDADALLYVPAREYSVPREAVLYYTGRAPSLALQSAVDHRLQSLLRDALLEDVYRLTPAERHMVQSTRLRFSVQDADTGRAALTQVRTVAASALVVLMVLAMLAFGTGVMRAMREERQNRMGELLAAAVPPVRLLTARVVAVAVAAVVQLLLWGGLTACGVAAVRALWASRFAQAEGPLALATKGPEAVGQLASAQAPDHLLQALGGLDVVALVAVFLLMFVLGYLFYGFLLVAVASRSDVHSESLPAVLLVCAPLLLAAVLMPVLSVGGFAAGLLTLLPFTAPVAVVWRLPFGLPIGLLVLSCLLLALGVAAAAWLAARCYRRHLLDA